MAKSFTSYVCQNCGGVSPKWAGQCPNCGAWNSLVEESTGSAVGHTKLKGKSGRSLQLESLHSEAAPPPRLATQISEFDRVCGGGLVPGSVVLIGGDPGIGKSTLMLQVASRLSQNSMCLYITGEESLDQVRLRAKRLGLENAPLALASTTHVGDIVATLDRAEAPKLVVIDSIQTMFVDTIESSPGTVAQVRAAAHELTQIAKRRGIVLILVGHVTKEGMIAGPKVLEHMVDVVLYFEGERTHQFRILRGIKNRFGATDEIGVFTMSLQGLEEVANPSALFLSDRQEATAGSAVFAGLEGTRPMLVEIQALVAPTSYGTPRRAVVGWDTGRLAMILAVLEARCGQGFGALDVYLNVAGGLKINEPAADLAVAAALLSAAHNIALPLDLVLFGEIGLSAEIRAVAQADLRLKEASKLGFHQALVPAASQKLPKLDLKISSCGKLNDLLKWLSI